MANIYINKEEALVFAVALEQFSLNCLESSDQPVIFSDEKERECFYEKLKELADKMRKYGQSKKVPHWRSDQFNFMDVYKKWTK